MEMKHKVETLIYYFKLKDILLIYTVQITINCRKQLYEKKHTWIWARIFLY